MAVNKVVMNTENGEKVLMDLTGDTVTPETLAEGVIAHDASGARIVGTLKTGVTIILVPMASNQETATLQDADWSKIQNDPCNTVIVIRTNVMDAVLHPTVRIEETYLYSTSFCLDGTMHQYTAAVANGELTLAQKTFGINSIDMYGIDANGTQHTYTILGKETT